VGKGESCVGANVWRRADAQGEPFLSDQAKASEELHAVGFDRHEMLAIGSILRELAAENRMANTVRRVGNVSLELGRKLGPGKSAFQLSQ